MKKIVLTFLILICNVSYAFDKEAICRLRIKSNTERAEWGIQLRNEMLKKCKVNIDVCAKPFLKQISDRDEKDNLKAIESFDRNNFSQTERVLTLAWIISDNTAALIGFKYDGKNANQVALENYSYCLK